MFNDNDDEEYYDSDSDEFAFGYDLPITADLTFGLGASSNRQQPLGIMVGYGVGHHRSYYSVTESSGEKETSKVSFSGQLVHLGLIFPIGRKKALDEDDDAKGLMIRFSYMEKQTKLNPYAFSIGAIFMFRSINQ